MSISHPPSTHGRLKGVSCNILQDSAMMQTCLRVQLPTCAVPRSSASSNWRDVWGLCSQTGDPQSGPQRDARPAGRGLGRVHSRGTSPHTTRQLQRGKWHVGLRSSTDAPGSEPTGTRRLWPELHSLLELGDKLPTIAHRDHSHTQPVQNLPEHQDPKEIWSNF